MNNEINIKLYNKLLIDLKSIHRYAHLCPVCGEILQVENHELICDELADDWELSKDEKRQINYREGSLCVNCKSSVRLRNLAHVILERLNNKFGTNLQKMLDIKTFFSCIKVDFAEINHCGTLHDYMEGIPKLHYSEYMAENKNIRSENLLNLTYDSNKFDFVLTSDVLEHVPDIEKSLYEIHRVLKEDGEFIFTVPFLLNRKTKKRANIGKDGQIKHLFKPSYHGDYSMKMIDHIVFYEFGYDFIELLKKYFEVNIYDFNDFGQEKTCVFICKKKVLK